MKKIIIIPVILLALLFVLPKVVPVATSLSYNLDYQVDLSKQFGIWTGEAAPDRSVSTDGSIVSSGANSGTYALKFDPIDQWHASGFYLTNLDAYRKSITSYDFIQMAIKVVPKPGTVLPTSPVVRFSIYGWQEGGDNTSNEVNVGNYIVGGGSLDSTYKIVRIPISALEKIGGFKAFTMEIMRFDGSGTETPSYSIYVDDIYAIDVTPNDVLSYKTLSNNSFKLVTKERYDMNAVSDLSQYSLRSDSDPNYSAARNPVKLGKESYVTGFEGSVGGSWGRDDAPLVESNLYLIFDKPLKNGVSYTLTINHLSDTRGNDLASPKTITFNYNDATVNGTVKASQVGYLPVSPKFAYIGNYTGDAGSLTISPTECQIRNASDGSLFKTYSTTFRGNDAKLSGEMVYDCDFSDLTTVGTYYVYIPGYGKTYNFRIGNDVYVDVTQKLLKLFYFQRANMVITSTYGGQWARLAGTPGDSAAVLHSSNYNSSLNPLMSSTDPASGATLDMTGGWYDAGDYGKYILTAGPTINDLLFAYELFPGKFFDGQNHIPESGNGIPDILDEVKYEIDWFSKMQAPDGGVFDRLASQAWLTSPYDTKQRFLVPKSTHDTAVYAAVLAQAYRVFKGNAKFEEKYPGYADALLRKAEKAWDFLTAHSLPTPAGGTDVNILGVGHGSGDYTDGASSNCPDGVTPPACPYSDVDNRAWAAAELYKSTGVETYQTAFKRYWPQTSPFYRPDNNFIFHNSKASYAYVTTTAHPTDATIVANIKTALKSIVGNPALPINGSGDDWYNHTYSNIYRNAYRSDVVNYICWGAYAQSPIKAFDLIKAAIILGDGKYLDAAKINLDTELGTNPQYKSYITGVGVDYPKNPLHLTSFWLRQNSGATAPVPGIPVYGPCSWGTGANSYNSQAQRDGNIYPSLQNGTYPILRRYFDISGMVEQSEFAINSIAPIAAAYAYFSNSATIVDSIIPQITIISPTSDLTYNTASSSITIGGGASDNVGVSSVAWSNDQGGGGTANGVTSWKAEISLQNGQNIITVIAYDAAGNIAVDTLAVTLDNAPPIISAVSSGDITATGATIAWITDKPADARVEYGASESYGNLSALNTATATAHSVLLNGLNQNATYHYRVISKDILDNVAVSADYTFTTAAAPTPPPAAPTPPPAAPTSGGGGGGGGGGTPIDTSAPTNISIIINNGLATTTSETVTLALSASDSSILKMMISNDSAFSGENWENYNTAKSWLLSGENGIKTVYAKFKDSSNNISAVVSGSISLNSSAVVLASKLEPEVLGVKIVFNPLEQILAEAAAIYNYNKFVDLDDITSQLYDFIIKKSQPGLTDQNKYAIASYIHNGTPTTEKLGAGERAGVLNSYLAAFGKLPKTEIEWQDVIKIANGRWPTERSAAAEAKAKASFKKIYGREAKMENVNDNAAVTIMAYGLRPSERNLNSEKAAILSFKYFIKRAPATAVDWDIVRAIAYSGAKR